MSCTLKELQNTELEILCKFADFCKENDLNYVLEFGSMIGAVRHDGFIPWDDDIDVIMDIRSFKKFIRLFRKNPIPGLKLTWIDNEPYAPFPFAKLRKEGTYMPEEYLQGIGLSNEVWIDIFTYIGKPSNAHIAAVQMQLFLNFTFMGKTYFSYAKDVNGIEPMKKSRKYKLLKMLPKKAHIWLRKFGFWLVTAFDRPKSEKVLITWWLTEKMKNLSRSYYEPVISHKFEDVEVNIPKNYDARLTQCYGDYMTPRQVECHVNLEEIEL